MYEHCFQKDWLYKFGNVQEVKSRFNFFQRMWLERQVLHYHNLEKSMFLFAYRAFLDAYAEQDQKTL